MLIEKYTCESRHKHGVLMDIKPSLTQPFDRIYRFDIYQFQFKKPEDAPYYDYLYFCVAAPDGKVRKQVAQIKICFNKQRTRITEYRVFLRQGYDRELIGYVTEAFIQKHFQSGIEVLEDNTELADAVEAIEDILRASHPLRLSKTRMNGIALCYHLPACDIARMILGDDKQQKPISAAALYEVFSRWFTRGGAGYEAFYMTVAIKIARLFSVNPELENEFNEFMASIGF